LAVLVFAVVLAVGPLRQTTSAAGAPTDSRDAPVRYDAAVDAPVDEDDDDDGRSPDFSPSNGGYAIFALRRECDDAGDASLSWSGSGSRVTGLVHSNGGFAVSGSLNTFTGQATYVCGAELDGAGNEFDARPARGRTQPPPTTFAAIDFACDFSPPGGDINQDGPWWEGGSDDSQQLRDGVYCAEGELRLKGSGVRGRVTLVATGPEGRVSVGGVGFELIPYANQVMAYAEGTDAEAIEIDGSGGTWEGILYAPFGQVALDGARIESPRGMVVADSVKLTGSDMAITGMVSAQATPTSANDGTGEIAVETRSCAEPDYPSDFDWFGVCTATTPDVEFSLAVWDGKAYQRVAEGVSDRDGMIRFERLAPGRYELKQSRSAWCRAESTSVNAKGELIVKAGQRVEVWIFNCDEAPK
jgi:hypothetical protein